ncbi:MAG: hypothetical protein H6645_05460 [Caldilineaceae bacterium]|nr:hypothetical protein [Caldilineaceae bacterium]
MAQRRLKTASALLALGETVPVSSSCATTEPGMYRPMGYSHRGKCATAD